MSNRSSDRGSESEETAVVEETPKTEQPEAKPADQPYIAKVVDIPPPSEEPTADEAPRIEVPKGGAVVVYRGNADVVTHGEYRFRHGDPVAVPSEVAEDLLTFPNEPFELVDPQKE